jgi:hypothetical protein
LTFAEKSASNAFSGLTLSWNVATQPARFVERPRSTARKLRTSSWERVHMFFILAIVLFIAWIGGFVMFKSAGMLIHLLLIFALISLVMHFVTGRRTV